MTQTVKFFSAPTIEGVKALYKAITGKDMSPEAIGRLKEKAQVKGIPVVGEFE